MNRAGQITLARSVLTTMPLYNMQTMWIPQQVCDEVDRLVRQFVWHQGRSRGLNLVSWDVVSRPRDCGSLGIQQARDMNVALLGKLIWEFICPNPKFWAVFTRQKYEPTFDALAPVMRGKGSSTWNAMVKA